MPPTENFEYVPFENGGSNIFTNIFIGGIGFCKKNILKIIKIGFVVRQNIKEIDYLF